MAGRTLATPQGFPEGQLQTAAAAALQKAAVGGDATGVPG